MSMRAFAPKICIVAIMLALSLMSMRAARVYAAQGDRSVQSDYRVQLSDALEVTFPFSPEYNQSLTVQPDGMVSLKEVAPIEAKGATLPQLEQRIADAYRGILRDPKVSVVLKDFQKPSYYASGEVGRPGRYELRASTSLLQAIAEAGGLIDERAKNTDVVIFRPQGNGTYESSVVNVKAILKAHDEVEDYMVRPGDVIYVPQNKFSKVARFLPSASMGASLTPAVF